MKALNKTAKIKHLIMAFGVVLFAAICFYVLRPRKPAKETVPLTPLEEQWQKLKPPPKKPFASIVLVLFLLVSGSAMAQNPYMTITPDCWQTALKLQTEVTTWKSKHRAADSLYRETYRTGQELIDAKDSDIEQAANQVAIAQTNLLNSETKVAELEKENKKWVPKTWLGRQLRYIERGAAIGFGVAVGVLLLAK